MLDSNIKKPISKLVNVATVPLRSPFRYPGGKTWLIPHIRRWLLYNSQSVNEFIEPFAGGGIVGLTAAFENLAEKVTLIELDEDVASVWKTILNGNANWLAEQIVSFEPASRSIDQVFKESEKSLEYRAFATIVKNRVNRGGILAPGAGLIKKGENGKGLKSRWYPQTLKKRILAINSIKDRIQFIEGDGTEFIKKNAYRTDVAFFIDPPYTVAGKRLYKYSYIDHDNLFKVIFQIKGTFLITYDDAREIRHLSKKYGFQSCLIPMKTTHHTKKKELIISRNFDWLDFNS